MGGPCRRAHHPSRRYAMVVAGAALAGAFILPARPAALPPNDSEAAIQHFLTRRIALRQYSGSRHLEASGSGQRAWLDVETDFATGSGFLYRVTGEGGSGYIRARVLRSLLDEEQRLI